MKIFIIFIKVHYISIYDSLIFLLLHELINEIFRHISRILLYLHCSSLSYYMDDIKMIRLKFGIKLAYLHAKKIYVDSLKKNMCTAR